VIAFTCFFCIYVKQFIIPEYNVAVSVTVKIKVSYLEKSSCTCELYILFLTHITYLVKLNPIHQKAFNFYKKNCQSIEVVKDDELQKANFRVKSKVSQE